MLNVNNRHGTSGGSRFRRSENMCRVINTVDGIGNTHIHRARGRMNTTDHNTILQMLEHRASRFRSGRPRVQLHEQLETQLDESGTLTAMGRFANNGNELLEARVVEERELGNINDAVLEVHRIQPGKKPDGVVRLIYENANGIDGRFGNNAKVDKAKHIHDELEVDVVAYNEHRLNMKHNLNKVGFSQLFWGGEAEVRSVVGHNIHSVKQRRIQEGGTSLLMFGGMVDYYDRTQSQAEESGLGRWVVMTLRGEVTTRIVCGYNPCGNDRPNSGTVYHQQRQYWVTKRKCLTCPRVKFREDLVEQLNAWRTQGDRLIVCLDANEDIYKKSIGKVLTSVDGLAMKEVVGEFTGTPIGPTYFRGSKPIDAIWATGDIQVAGACIMPAGYGIGDHRLFVVDFVASSLTGSAVKQIVRPQARRLKCKIPGAVLAYNKRLEGHIRKHRLVERLGVIHTADLPVTERKRLLDNLDAESTNLMKNAERKCRRIKSGQIPFSPEAAKWIRRLQVYRSLLRNVRGGTCNRGNARRAALRAGIEFPFSLSEAEILARMEVCSTHCEYYQHHGAAYRKRHLNDRLEKAKETGDETAETQILGIIKREHERSFWRRVKYKLGKQTGGSVQAVQIVDGEGNTEVFSTQAEVHEAIWSNIHRQRFFLAEEAPICNGPLREMFGYNADTLIGDEILDGSFAFDRDFDDATRGLCTEVAEIREKIPEDSVADIVRRGEWGSFWKKAREETSSSVSGLHFGHYKAGAHSDLISHFHAMKGSVMVKTGRGFERWGRGLSVMLEKIPGCQLISKLRSILLMEADFNCVNKLIFGCRMMNNVRKYGMMPDEIFSEKHRMADEGTLTKVLFYDIVRQTRLSAGIASVDADNCYDRVAHAIASLVFRSFGVSKEASGMMLTTIQNMKFFLRTAFGDSKDFAGSVMEIKTQGLCQGNGAAPAGWAVVSIALLNAHKKRGHGAKFLCPISLVRSDLSAVIYVDDTDVVHVNMERGEDKYEALDSLQQSVTSWGNLLIATGGALKPEKCFYHLISFSWKADGSWVYDTNEEDEELQLYIPLPTGSVAPIEHCGVDMAHKTLGTMTCPSGSTISTIDRMKEITKGWIDRATSANLSRRDLWFMATVQLQPKVLYGIGTCSAPYPMLAECLMKQYYNMVPMGGVRRSANRLVRQLDRGFYGAGCPHPGVECLAAQLSKLLSHYGCATATGRLLQVSVELFILELGMGSQPFQVDFQKYGHWVTESWVKSLWEKVSLFGIVIEEGKLRLTPPRERDEWLMPLLTKLNFTPLELGRLNKVRIHQQALFLSDVMDARGTIVDRRYDQRRLDTDRWSRYRFPLQSPPQKDFRLWRHALRQLRYVRSGLLGAFKEDGHKIWEWRFNAESNSLLRYHEEGMDIYSPSQVPRYASRPNCWTRSRVDRPTQVQGVICSVRSIALGVWKIASHAPRDRLDIPPTTLEGIFKKWGCGWLWKDLRWQGNERWLPASIQAQDCVVVADGSFMPHLRKDLCSTAFFFECQSGRGQLVGSFAEFSSSANAYRGELLGLMASLLVLKGVAELSPHLTGKVIIYSDCEGAVDKVSHLPADRLPGRCRHSDILKTILLECGTLPFAVELAHIEAHQDDKMDFRLLSRPAQLNCAVDAGAKKCLMEADISGPPSDRRRFPLESIACFVGKNKITSDAGDAVRFWAQRRLAREALVDGKVLLERQFDVIAWEAVYEGLRSVPPMFQLWACKQVWDIAGTNYPRAKWDKSVKKWCPSCRRAKETAGHVLACSEVGRVDTLHRTIDLVASWLREVDTSEEICRCVISFARGRGYRTMQEVCRHMGPQFQAMAVEQDTIGWRRFMEGMISKRLVCLQEDARSVTGMGLAGITWAQQLVVRLLEVTHGQWIYRNIQVHDEQSGTLRTQEKEQLQRDIEEELDMGFEGFLAMDRSLADVTLKDLESGGGIQQEYWLLAVRAARCAKALAQQNTAIDTQPD